MSKHEMQARAAAITEGCKPCDCGAMPHGMEQPEAKFGGYFEIGCLDDKCKGKRVFGIKRSHAVLSWNEQDYSNKPRPQDAAKGLGPKAEE